MKCGVRRFQNSDGSLTTAGKKRYRNINADLNKMHRKDQYKFVAKLSADVNTYQGSTLRDAINKRYYDNQPHQVVHVIKM